MRNKKDTPSTFRLPSQWAPLYRFLKQHPWRISWGNQSNTCPSEIQISNISKQERTALNDLSNNQSIVIKKYDKGWVCLLDTHYHNHHHQQLGLKYLNCPSYELILNDTTQESASTIYDKLEEMHDNKHIDENAFSFLNPYRPIVVWIHSVTYTTSNYLDYFLNPIAASQHTYLGKSADLITKLQHIKIAENALLASVGIKVMNANIDN